MRLDSISLVRVGGRQQNKCRLVPVVHQSLLRRCDRGEFFCKTKRNRHHAQYFIEN
jgi:hypothetical protein